MIPGEYQLTKTIELAQYHIVTRNLTLIAEDHFNSKTLQPKVVTSTPPPPTVTITCGSNIRAFELFRVTPTVLFQGIDIKQCQTVGMAGAALYMYHSTVNIIACSFDNNTATSNSSEKIEGPLNTLAQAFISN